jgi:hypothetical protein
MVRSALAFVAILILPAFVAGQEIPATHTVVDGDCLWNLAQTYYGDPFEWRRIWDANRSEVVDPNLILPDQILIIPDGQSAVTVVVVEEPIEEEPEPQPPPMAEQRTIFHQDTAVIRAGVIRGADVAVLAIPRDRVYSAPRLIGLEGIPDHDGTIAGMAGGSAPGGMVRTYDRIRLTVTGTMPRVGDRYQLFKVERVIEDVGRVVIPTGVATVTDAADGTVIAMVDKEYSRVSVGDFIGPLPTFSLVVGQQARPATGGSAAMVMGFARGGALQDLNDVAFLDLGLNDGIGLGDEFDLYNPSAGTDVIEGTLQVVGVSAETSAARIIQMDDAVFRQGVVVRFAKKMR